MGKEAMGKCGLICAYNERRIGCRSKCSDLMILRILLKTLKSRRPDAFRSSAILPRQTIRSDAALDHHLLIVSNM